MSPQPATFLRAEPRYSESGAEQVVYWFDVDGQTLCLAIGTEEALDIEQQTTESLFYFEFGETEEIEE